MAEARDAGTPYSRAVVNCGRFRSVFYLKCDLKIAFEVLRPRRTQCVRYKTNERQC